MKILTLNFLTCARKACKSSSASFPLHPRDAELEIVEVDINPLFLRNILPRLEWDALKTICVELGLPPLRDEPPHPELLFGVPTSQDPDTQSQPGQNAAELAPSQIMKDLHGFLMETNITSGKLVCGACGHEYLIKEGIANFLLPSHLV